MAAPNAVNAAMSTETMILRILALLIILLINVVNKFLHVFFADVGPVRTVLQPLSHRNADGGEFCCCLFGRRARRNSNACHV